MGVQFPAPPLRPQPPLPVGAVGAAVVGRGRGGGGRGAGAGAPEGDGGGAPPAGGGGGRGPARGPANYAGAGSIDDAKPLFKSKDGEMPKRPIGGKNAKGAGWSATDTPM